MANYKPKAVTVGKASAISGTAVYKNISTSTWGLFLLKGTAVSPGGNSVLPSGGVQVWESGTLTTSPANHTTFSDVNGKYGVTCKANIGLTIKFYSK